MWSRKECEKTSAEVKVQVRQTDGGVPVRDMNHEVTEETEDKTGK